jgi:hypothetical protein
MMLTCVAPSGGIAVAGAPAGAPSQIAPTPSAATVPIFLDDEGGSVKQVDTALVYNIDAYYAVPAGVPCLLERTPNGHYYVAGVLASATTPAPGMPPSTYRGLGQVPPPYAVFGAPGNRLPPPPIWLGPLRF